MRRGVEDDVPFLLIFAFTFTSPHLSSPACQTLLLPTQLGKRAVLCSAPYVAWVVGILCSVAMEADGTGFERMANKAETEFLGLFRLHV